MFSPQIFQTLQNLLFTRWTFMCNLPQMQQLEHFLLHCLSRLLTCYLPSMHHLSLPEDTEQTSRRHWVALYFAHPFKGSRCCQKVDLAFTQRLLPKRWAPCCRALLTCWKEAGKWQQEGRCNWGKVRTKVNEELLTMLLLEQLGHKCKALKKRVGNDNGM